MSNAHYSVGSFEHLTAIIPQKKWNYISSICILLFSFILASCFYSEMPDEIPIHWNANGEVDGYGPKELGLFVIPVILTGLYLLLMYIPKIDPLRKNISGFKEEYEWFVVVFLLFMLSVQLLTISWGMGYEINVQYVIFPGIAVLFFFVGELLGKTKRNWFIGIRTPWTLSSEKVWDKTNKLGAKLFKLYAILIIFALVLGINNIWVIIVPMLLMVLWCFIYSYLEFQKL